MTTLYVKKGQSLEFSVACVSEQVQGAHIAPLMSIDFIFLAFVLLFPPDEDSLPIFLLIPRYYMHVYEAPISNVQYAFKMHGSHARFAPSVTLLKMRR